MPIDARNGKVAGHYADEDVKQKNAAEQLELPPDLANGLVLTLLKNVRPDSPPKSLSYVVAMPSPRLIELDLSVSGRAFFFVPSCLRD